MTCAEAMALCNEVLADPDRDDAAARLARALFAAWTECDEVRAELDRLRRSASVRGLETAVLAMRALEARCQRLELAASRREP